MIEKIFRYLNNTESENIGLTEEFQHCQVFQHQNQYIYIYFFNHCSNFKNIKSKDQLLYLGCVFTASVIILMNSFDSLDTAHDKRRLWSDCIHIQGNWSLCCVQVPSSVLCNIPSEAATIKGKSDLESGF